MRRKELTEHQWSKIAPLLPPQKPKRGRPAKDHRGLINAILWVLRTGAPSWRDLPKRYGPWQTAASRFYGWQKTGIWQRVLEELQKDKDRSGEVEWEIHFLDSTLLVRAHQHAAGAKGGSKSRL